MEKNQEAMVDLPPPPEPSDIGPLAAALPQPGPPAADLLVATRGFLTDSTAESTIAYTPLLEPQNAVPPATVTLQPDPPDDGSFATATNSLLTKLERSKSPKSPGIGPLAAALPKPELSVVGPRATSLPPPPEPPDPPDTSPNATTHTHLKSQDLDPRATGLPELKPSDVLRR